MSRTAILWPAGIVTMARTLSFVTSVPVGISTRAMTTSSWGCRRMVRSAAWSMGTSRQSGRRGGRKSALRIGIEGALGVRLDRRDGGLEEHFLDERLVLFLPRGAQRPHHPGDRVAVLVQVRFGIAGAQLLRQHIQQPLVVHAVVEDSLRAQALQREVAVAEHV